MPFAVEVEKLKKNYAGEHALAGTSFNVPTGSMFGLIGADGAGKTTLMRILTTLIRSDSGSAFVLGYNAGRDLSKIRSLLGYMPQRFSLYQDLSVEENLDFFSGIFCVRGKEKKERSNRLMQFSRLSPYKSRRAGHLSGGMKQKLALSCALIHEPPLLLLDEPTTGVDPVSRNEFWGLLAELKKNGTTIVVSTPYMEEASLCDYLLLLHKGHTLHYGTPQELLQTYKYRLYGVKADKGPLAWPKNMPLPKGAVHLYPSGGSLRMVVHKQIDARNDIRSAFEAVFPHAIQVEEMKPTIEDLFFVALAEVQEQKTK
jgi:ABC-2 type transport system ATP-binding protein